MKYRKQTQLQEGFVVEIRDFDASITKTIMVSDDDESNGRTHSWWKSHIGMVYTLNGILFPIVDRLVYFGDEQNSIQNIL